MLEYEGAVIEVKEKEEDGSLSRNGIAMSIREAIVSREGESLELEQERVVPFLENGSFVTPTSETFVEYLKSSDEIKV